MMKWARWGMWHSREHIYVLQGIAAPMFKAFAAMWQWGNWEHTFLLNNPTLKFKGWQLNFFKFQTTWSFHMAHQLSGLATSVQMVKSTNKTYICSNPTPPRTWTSYLILLCCGLLICKIDIMHLIHGNVIRIYWECIERELHTHTHTHKDRENERQRERLT